MGELSNAEHFGRRLRAAREQRGHSLRGLARETGISFVTLWRIEMGQNEPRVEVLRELCLELNVSADWLLGVE